MAGVVRVSADSGKTWTTGAQIVARDLSVDPSKPDTVYATTARGLAVSTDGARTFALVPNAPALYLVDSLNDKSGGLIGVDVDGTIWVNQDGTTWTSTGTINGVTEALTYASAPSARLVVATEEGILASTDQGATWRDVVVN
ncbi:hypothetical protein EEJ31_09925 [Cryobacterium tepidiphilum]|uniref:Exo-alpha-sialidase n=2 Tax=Cryobacterium tepidiphilum TaxID=2486026 RepID=A0A3M8L371_9MICO|nr:hypothetical protein EEJ31_09925 [Cryobacterium tepidiphilum]